MPLDTLQIQNAKPVAPAMRVTSSKQRTSTDYLKAAAKAREAGDTEAYDLIMKSAVEAFQRETPSAVEGMGALERGAAGYSRSVRNIGRNIGNVLGVVSDEEMADANALDAALMKTEGGKAGGLLGETVTLAPAGAGLTSATARALPFAGRVLANPIARGAYEGAAQGSLMAGPNNRGLGAAQGALFGAALPATGTAAKKLARGMKRTPEADYLLSQGVDLTPGQANPRGMYNQLEEATQSVPIIGPAIKGARDQAGLSFTKSTIRQSAAPGAQVADASPDTMLQQAYDSFQPLYDQAKGFPLALYRGKPVQVNTGTNVPLSTKLANIVRKNGPTAQSKQDAQSFLENEFSRQFKTSDDLLKMRSNIRTRIRKLRKDGSINAEDTADVLADAEKAVTETLESQLPPDAMNALRTADRAYGNYKIVEKALYSAKDRPEGFTPNQLSTAVQQATPDGVYARGGGGQNREMARAGRETMDVRVPPTGARVLTSALAIPTAGGVYVPMAIASGTRAGRKLALGQTKPQLLATALGQQWQSRLTAEQRKALAAGLERATVTAALQNTQVRE